MGALKCSGACLMFAGPPFAMEGWWIPSLTAYDNIEWIEEHVYECTAGDCCADWTLYCFYTSSMSRGGILCRVA